jgi:hypothetical protein
MMEDMTTIVDTLLSTSPKILAEQVASSSLWQQENALIRLNLLQRKWNEFFETLEEQVLLTETQKVQSSALEIHNEKTGIERRTPEETTDEVDDDDGSRIPLPLETVRQVAQSGFLTSKELGRFLLLSSPSIPRHLGHDFIWNCLCHSKFPELLSPSIVGLLLPRRRNNQKKYSQEWIFRQFSKSIPSTDSPFSATSTSTWVPLTAPTLKPEDLIMLVQWYASKDDPRPIATIPITPDQLLEFLEVGQVKVPAPSNLCLTINDMHKVHLTIHCVRLDRQECCCLHETGEYSWDPNPMTMGLQEVLVQDEPALVVPNHPLSSGNLFFGPRVPVLLETSGRDLETRLARGDREPGGFELLVMANTTTTCQQPSGDQWQVEQLVLQFWANYSDQLYVYDSSEQATKHGVTLLHILDELQGWKD